MRKFYTAFFVAAFLPLTGNAQGCPSNLFFSEYIEGSSFNKVVEIYNPLPYTVDLNDYVIELYTNGSPTASAQFFMGGSIAPGDVYIVCHPSSNAAILALKDTVSGVINFNGDDAILLKHELTFDTLDIIGIVGVDPGTSWPVGAGTTVNTTLVRNSTIGVGTTDWAVSATQWSDFATDYLDSLGTHYCNAPTNVYTFENYSICDNDSLYIQSSHYESVAGIYYDTLAAISGCDSIIVTELFLYPTYLTAVDTSTCPGGSVFIGGAFQTVPGFYYDTLATVNGCDSVIEYNYTFLSEALVQVSETICAGDSLFLEGGWQLLDGVYTDTYTSVLTGCDSIVETTLTVNVVNTNIILTGYEIEAEAAGLTYQWLDCLNGHAVIPGATGQTYTVTANGDYALKVTDGACTDTSGCVNVTGIGFDEMIPASFVLYPNPAATRATIDFGSSTTATIDLVQVNGQVVQTVAVVESYKIELDLEGIENGTYFVIVTSADGRSMLPFVISE